MGYILEALTDGHREVKRLEMTDVARLLVSCSTPFIIKWLSKKTLLQFPLPIVFKLLAAYGLDLAQNIATGAVKVHPKARSFLVMNLLAKLIWLLMCNGVVLAGRYSIYSILRVFLASWNTVVFLVHCDM